MVSRKALRAVLLASTALVTFFGTGTALAGNTSFTITTTTKSNIQVTVPCTAWAPSSNPVNGVLLYFPGRNHDTLDRPGKGRYSAIAAAYNLAVIGFDRTYDNTNETRWMGNTQAQAIANVATVLSGAATALGHSELNSSTLPLMFEGFSNGGATGAYLANAMPSRTICFVSEHGETWLDAGSMNSGTENVQALYIGGTRDGTVDKQMIYTAYDLWTQVALMDDWNIAHSQTPDDSVYMSFMASCISTRFPSGSITNFPFSSGWYVQPSFEYTNSGGTQTYAYQKVTTPASGTVSTYVKPDPNDITRTCWVPTKAMTAVLKTKNTTDPNDSTASYAPVILETPTAKAENTFGFPNAFATGQTIQLNVHGNTNYPLANITEVAVFHGNSNMHTYTSLPADGDVYLRYTPTTTGTETFWVRVKYTDNGVDQQAYGYLTFTVLPAK